MTPYEEAVRRAADALPPLAPSQVAAVEALLTSPTREAQQAA